MELEKEQVIAMAVAVIAEDQQEDLSRIRVVSFREVQKSSLEQFVEDHHILYKKYQLGEE